MLRPACPRPNGMGPADWMMGRGPGRVRRRPFLLIDRGPGRRGGQGEESEEGRQMYSMSG